MSTCREAFEQLCKEQGIVLDSPFSMHLYAHCKVMWNAATLNAVEICIKQRADTNDEDAVGWNTACTECAEAIEKEQYK